MSTSMKTLTNSRTAGLSHREVPRTSTSRSLASRSKCCRQTFACALDRSSHRRVKQEYPPAVFKRSSRGGPNYRNDVSVRAFGAPRPAAASGGYSRDLWEAVLQIQKQLQIAIDTEDYAAAARLRDQAEQYTSEMSINAQLLLKSVADLENSDVDVRRKAAETISTVGDERAEPYLRTALFDKEDRVHEKVEEALWVLWCRSGNPKIDRELQEGMLLMKNRATYPSAKKVFSDVIKAAPTFAEGYNKRATVNYLMQEYGNSIDDCKMTVAINEMHFGAYSGMGLCHLALNELDEALEAFQTALSINPRMPEIQRYADQILDFKQKGKDQDSDNLFP
mmetsp:Transcript_11497/g.13640  ORF Transcript_11497/g.13640 Transcript_11497/m.13640 type:complete len:336 (+) Transcript_11497:155-1162(+)